MIQNIRYFDECKWQEDPTGLRIEFFDKKGERLAEVSLVNFEAKLWKFEVFLPEKFHVDGRNASGIVYSAPAAKRVAETILLNTIVMRA